MEPTAPAPTGPGPRHVADVGVLVRRTQHLLQAGVPLTLLLDLAEDDPHSGTRYATEQADLSWLTPRR